MRCLFVLRVGSVGAHPERGIGLCCGAMKQLRRNRGFSGVDANAPAIPKLRIGFLVLASTALLIAAGCEEAPTLEQIKAVQNAGRAAQTLEPLREMIDGGERSAEVFYLYGVALSANGEFNGAMWPLRKAMEDPDWTARAGMQMASDSYSAGNFELAVDICTTVLELEPENTNALVLRARARIDTRRDIELALADADAAIEIDADLHAARVARTVALLALEREEEAAEALEEIELLAYEEDPDQPNSARYCGARATFAREKGDQPLADERYTTCLERYPGSVILVEDALKFYEGLGQAERAREILAAALEASPDEREFRVGLAIRQAAAGRVEEAEATLRSSTDSDDPKMAAMAWLDLSGFLLERDRADDGVEAISKALELISNPAPELRFRYADALIAAGRFDEALAETENMRISAHQHLVRGRVHVARKQWADALREFETGLMDWPENAVARYYAAVAAEGVGDFDRAVEEFRYSIRASSTQTDARLRLAKFHNAEGLYEDAIAILRHDIAGHPPTPEMAALELAIIARVTGNTVIPQHLGRAIGRPGEFQRAYSGIVEAVHVRSGPEKALELLAASTLDLLDPVNARLLRDQIGLLGKLDRVEEAVALGRRASETQPESAGAHAAMGLSLLLAEDFSAAKAAFDRARELDAGNADALIGLARHAEIGGDLAAAVDLYVEADAAEPRDTIALEAAIDVLMRTERFSDAEAKLELLLEREPYFGRASLRLVELRVARGAGDEERTRVLARHAMRFGGAGPAAEKVLAAN